MTVDKDRIAGSAKEIKGSLKEAVGKAVGDTKLQTEGKADQAEGKISECRRRPQRHAQRRSEEIGPQPLEGGRLVGAWYKRMAYGR